MVQNYAWTHRNPARYHSTTRLIMSNYNSFVFLFFGSHWKSGVFAFFFPCGPGVPAFLLDGLVVQDLPYTEIHAKFQNWRLGHIADMSDMCCQFVEQNFVESFFDILRY